VQNSMPWLTLLGVDEATVEAIDPDLKTSILVASLCDLAPGSLS
jgi:hypothetical protein